MNECYIHTSEEPKPANLDSGRNITLCLHKANGRNAPVELTIVNWSREVEVWGEGKMFHRFESNVPKEFKLGRVSTYFLVISVQHTILRNLQSNKYAEFKQCFHLHCLNIKNI